jgi:hypothetical protein
MVTDSWSTVGGGAGNKVGNNNTDALDATCATVGGGCSNSAISEDSTIGGGYHNDAAGLRSTVPGGNYNTAAGDYSLAAGRRAKIDAAHHGAFLFADQNNFDFDSVAANEFAIRCTGGARFVTDIDGSGNPTAQVSMESEERLKARSLSVDSAQRTTIPTGVRSHDVTVPSGITIGTDAMIFVTIMNNSSNIGVRWVERLSSDQFRVHLTGLSRNDLNIGYCIVN